MSHEFGDLGWEVVALLTASAPEQSAIWCVERPVALPVVVAPVALVGGPRGVGHDPPSVPLPLQPMAVVPGATHLPHRGQGGGVPGVRAYATWDATAPFPGVRLCQLRWRERERMVD